VDWMTRLHEPFFRSRNDVENYLSQELRAAVPEGWEFRRAGEELNWTIRKQGSTFPQESYAVRVTVGLDLVILYHGNSDAGPFGLRQVLNSAMVIDSVLLRAFSLRQCLAKMFAECEPNVYGLT